MSIDDIDDIYEHLSQYEKLIGVRPSCREPDTPRATPEEYGRKHKKPLILLPRNEGFSSSLRWQFVVIALGIFLSALGLAGLFQGIGALGSGNAFTGEITATGGLAAYSIGLILIIVGTGTLLKRRSESSMQKNLEEIREQNRIIIELLRRITSELIFGF